MKSQLHIVKDLIKKYPNDMQLGAAVRSFLTEDYWKRPRKKQKSKWEKELSKWEKELDSI